MPFATVSAAAESDGAEVMFALGTSTYNPTVDLQREMSTIKPVRTPEDIVLLLTTPTCYGISQVIL